MNYVIDHTLLAFVSLFICRVIVLGSFMEDCTRFVYQIKNLSHLTAQYNLINNFEEGIRLLAIL